MPSHNLDPNDSKNVGRLLISIIREHGGELRIKAPTYDSYDKGCFLIIDYDPAANEIVLRSTSNYGRAMVVPPENATWLRNPDDVNRPTIQAQQNVQRRTVRSDEELAEFEEARTREAQLAREASAGRIHFRTETSPAAASPRTMNQPEPTE
jgi:hypothetical protein